MPTILRFGGLRVIVYPSNHRPAHVHVIGQGCEVIFILNCPQGPVEIRENYGFSGRMLKVIWQTLNEHHTLLCQAWEAIMASHSEFQLANARAREMQKTFPRAVSVHYDRKNGRVVVELSSKLALTFRPQDAQGLENAKASDLSEIEITPSGFGIHFPRLDADLYVPGLLEGFLGSRKWMAARLGEVGGQSRSRAKKAAARANGRLGGRPRKKAGEAG